MSKRVYDLEVRLVEYSVRMIDVVEALPNTRAGNYIASQLIRSCNSPAFNYGEAQAAESRNDFIHKMKIILKELKECRIALRIISRKNLIDATRLQSVHAETEELISIIGKSIRTAISNRTDLKIEH